MDYSKKIYIIQYWVLGTVKNHFYHNMEDTERRSSIILLQKPEYMWDCNLLWQD